MWNLSEQVTVTLTLNTSRNFNSANYQRLTSSSFYYYLPQGRRRLYDQVVVSVCVCYAEVIFDFDLTAVRRAFDGVQLLITGH